MVVIGIIAILSAIGIPAYQNYRRKSGADGYVANVCPLPYCVELCALEHGGTRAHAMRGVNGIPSPVITVMFRA